MFFQCFLSSLGYILILTTILMISIILTKTKRAYPPKVQNTSERQALFIANYEIYAQKGKNTPKKQ